MKWISSEKQIFTKNVFDVYFFSLYNVLLKFLKYGILLCEPTIHYLPVSCFLPHSHLFLSVTTIDESRVWQKPEPLIALLEASKPQRKAWFSRILFIHLGLDFLFFGQLFIFCTLWAVWMEQNVIHIRNYYAGHLLDLCLPRFDSLLLVWALLGVATQYTP